MSTCYKCKTYYREPEDEQGEHHCPKCGYYWADEQEVDLVSDAAEYIQYTFDQDEIPTYYGFLDNHSLRDCAEVMEAYEKAMDSFQIEMED